MLNKRLIGESATRKKRSVSSIGEVNSPAGHGRQDVRVVSSIPVKLDGAQGITRDISASGVFFEIDSDSKIGSVIKFSLELSTPGGVLNINCEGEVIRLEQSEGKLGVAVKITNQTIA